MDLKIINGKIYHKNQFIEADIGIKDGRIIKLKRNLSANSDEVINAKGKYVIPGIIDAHVHLRDLKQSYKETFSTGAKAAAHGGVTTVLNMPNTNPPAINLRVIKELNTIKKNACVNIELFGGVKCESDEYGVKNNFNEIPKMRDFVCGYKAFMDSENFSKENFAEIFQFFDGFYNPRIDKKLTVKPIAVHAEDGGLIKKSGRDNKSCEIEAIKFVSELSRKFDFPIHICHVSTPEGLEIIKDSALTCEVTPHHLFLSKGDYEYDAVNPPLRTKQDRLNLWKNLNEIDIIATDHAPHISSEKEDGISGFPGLETALSLMLDSVNKGRLTFKRLIEMMSEKPAEIFNLENKGKIDVGFDADLTVVDMKKVVKIRGDEFWGKQKWTPFEGWKVKGVATDTVVMGKIVMDDGELI